MVDTACTPVGTAQADTALLVDGLTRLSHSLSRVRAQIVTHAQHDIEWSASVLIETLVERGAMRTGALAEAVHVDPSTVSRAVAALVADGVIAREPDPSDRRAATLVPTAKAAAVLDRHRELGRRHCGQVVAGWSAAEVSDFARLLHRFAQDFDHYQCARGVSGWLSAEDSRRGQGTH